MDKWFNPPYATTVNTYFSHTPHFRKFGK